MSNRESSRPRGSVIANGSVSRIFSSSHWLNLGVVYVFVFLLLCLGRYFSADFWDSGNLLQAVRDVSILGIVSVGVAFITYSGHYVDLSIPGIMASSGIVAVALLDHGFLPGILGGLLTGTLLGFLNGLVVGYLRLNPIIWTLAAMALIDGTTRWAYGGKWIYADENTAAGAIFSGLYREDLAGLVPGTVILFALTAVAGYAILRHTTFGRQLKLTGSSYEVARLSGIPVRRTVLFAFLISGFTAALGGIIKTSLNMYGDVEIGATYDFQAITAVVIGGVTLAGGRGSMAGVIGGVLIIGLLGRILPSIPENFLPLIKKVGQDEQFIIRGAIFIAVVGLSMYSLRRRGRDDT